MWLLGRILPLVIADKVPNDDDCWENNLRMMDIVDHLFCPRVHGDDMAYLQAVINDHHREFRSLYPNSTIIPKMHFMLHMPHLAYNAVEFVLFRTCVYITWYGPLVRLWKMRYKAKHSYFKSLSQAMGNFINLPYSLAMRHQFLQCYLNIT